MVDKGIGTIRISPKRKPGLECVRLSGRAAPANIEAIALHYRFPDHCSGTQINESIYKRFGLLLASIIT
jgi:hypothetical protein